MSCHKYHVTIEDVDDEDNMFQQQQNQKSAGIDDLDVEQMSSEEAQSMSSERQAWNEVDAMEEQARSEKMNDQSSAKANAYETARIVKEAQQNSG